ncbi:MAG: ABC transporter ATP-binding protein [Promicromonosporaceae bacterium]|nr:ABC transporter ATP-binding protein [Promicromonosporaceae bacterium]
MTLSFAAAVPERGFDVALEVPEGRTLALLGPNGAGKSTLLESAAGLLRPHDARISVGGRDLTVTERGRTRVWVPPHARGVGLLAQDARLFPHLSVLENVAFGPRAAGVPRGIAREAAQGLLDDVGVGDLAARRPRQLSGGQAQRVAIARALATDPALVLLDEPLAALDADVTPALRHTLHRVLAGRTAVVATHDVLDALLLADDVAVLDGGRVVEHGPAQEVLTRPRSAFAARVAGLDVLAGTWDGEALRTAAGEHVRGVLEGELTVGDVAVAAFRPSAVAVHLTPVTGSPRNTWERTVTALEPQGDLVRVRCGDLAADVTPASVAELRLAPGLPVFLTVKAAEVRVYPR